MSTRAPWWNDGSEPPPTGALMPSWLARLAGFAPLAALGALEWQRMIGGLASAQALLWALAALVVGAALVAVDARARHRRVAVAAVVVAGVVLAVLVSGMHLGLLRPSKLDDAAAGLVAGAQTLGTIKLPYASFDPWPGVVLELLGSGLLMGAALLAFWPRRGERGFPFLSLALLLVLVASPVVSLGGARSGLLGVVLATLCVCFLLLERLPLRPGLGVAALLGIALAGALPIAATADRGQPWFDYRSFAEGIGPNDPVHFDWSHHYGPIDWPRDGNEVLRVKSDQPYYWKAANLEDFDGVGFAQRKPGEVNESTADDVPEDWRNRPGWTSTIEVQIKRLTSPTVITAGTTMAVESSSKVFVPSGLPGIYDAVPSLRRGDSYTLQVHVPKPEGGALRDSDTGLSGEQADDLQVTIPLKHRISWHALGKGGHGRVRQGVLHTRPYGDGRRPYIEFPSAGRSLFDVPKVMRDSGYWRTWKLAQRLERGTRTPLDYIVKVNRYLQQGFSYSERPTPVRRGVEPLDGFLFDTKEGYCQHFAGAMALLLRMGGVPSRVATGFSPGGYSSRYHAWIVRDTDAHAWVEAWFDGTGWVTYDPTPLATPARSQIAALTEPPPGTDTPATPVAGGARGGAAVSSHHGLRPDLTIDLQRHDAAATHGRLAAGGGMPWWGWVLLALPLLGVVAALVVLVRRARMFASLPPVERAIAELEAALRRAGRPAPVGTTLRQLEGRLGNSPEANEYLRALSAARYGEAPLPTPNQRRAMRRALAEGLGFSGVLRAWWALPPRAPSR